jgi:hypothetical protein
MSTRRLLSLALALVSGGVLLGYLAAGGLAGPSAVRPVPAAEPVQVASRAASTGEAAAAGLAKATSRTRRQTLKTRISRHAIRTKSGEGSFVGLTCPRRYVALSGGVLSGFNDLLISHSAPLSPTGRHRYTPRTWWVAVTNVSENMSQAALPWYPVVNCVNRIRVGT